MNVQVASQVNVQGQTIIFQLLCTYVPMLGLAWLALLDTLIRIIMKEPTILVGFCTHSTHTNPVRIGNKNSTCQRWHLKYYSRATVRIKQGVDVEKQTEELLANGEALLEPIRHAQTAGDIPQEYTIGNIVSFISCKRCIIGK